MNAAGIIAEYNPFHNGHKYHISETRNATKANCIIVIMSGDFVQRGEPAIMNKYLRTKCALSCGADLVIELPCTYALGSAEYFAKGSVKLLSKLGISFLSFGSESGSITDLTDIAKILLEEPDSYKQDLKKYLTQGNSFPKARELAIANINSAYASILSGPNNILAIEYLKALLSTNKEIIPVTIPRNGDSYHAPTTTFGVFPSATALRKLICSGELKELQSFIPKECWDVFFENYQKTYPIVADDFSSLLNYRMKLLIDDSTDFTTFPDISTALSNRLVRLYTSGKAPFLIHEVADALKSKEITYSRVMRCLMRILCNQHQCSGDYIRILGFNKIGQEYLNSIKKSVNVPIITKTALAKDCLKSDLLAADIYNQLVYQKFGSHIPDEFTYGVLRQDC